MSRKHFNWYYATASEIGRSHVHDNHRKNACTFSVLDEPVVAKRTSPHDDDAKAHLDANPHLLRNIYA